MFNKAHHRDLRLEASLFLICGLLTILLYFVEGFKMVVLNLFYLPVVLAAFHLGRHRAGILALVCVLFASIAAVQDLESYAAATSPLVIGLALTVWGAVMGLNAIFVGTLSDQRTKTIDELHDAYVGVVEVLARYLKSADPALNDRSKRVAELGEKVGRQMRLAHREVDDIRIAALLQDVQNVEVTAKVIHRAMGDLTANSRETHTFSGSDLVHSLSSVLAGALPLIMYQTVNTEETAFQSADGRPRDAAFGAQILRTVTQFDALVHLGPKAVSPQDALQMLRDDLDGEYHPAVLHALEQVTIHAKSHNLDRVLALTATDD